MKQTREQIQTTVLSLINGMIGHGDVKISADSVLSDPPIYFDELDNIEFIMSLEEAFEIEIVDDKREAIKTVGDAVNFVCTKVGV